MTFTIWISEFCSDHVKLQTIYEILEANRLQDLIGIVKTLIIPRRLREIDIMFNEYNYENGKRHGISRGWYENGQIYYEENCEHGKFNGIQKMWYENGQINYADNYENGKRNGLCKGWYENGQIAYESNYEHGELIN